MSETSMPLLERTSPQSPEPVVREKLRNRSPLQQGPPGNVVLVVDVVGTPVDDEEELDEVEVTEVEVVEIGPPPPVRVTDRSSAQSVPGPVSRSSTLT